MSPSLLDIHSWLEQSPSHSIGIYTPDKNYVEAPTNKRKLDTKHGGFTKLLEKLFTQGHTSVFIYKEKGTETFPTIEYLLQTAGMSPKKPEKVSEVSTQPRQPIQIPHTMGTGAFTGLTGQEYVSSLQQENQELKKKLKKKKKALKQYEKPQQGLTGEAVIETLTKPEVLDVVGNIFSFLSKSPQEKTAPTTTENQQSLSEYKVYLINEIKRPELTDDDTAIMYDLIQLMIKRDKETIEFIQNIIKEKKT